MIEDDPIVTLLEEDWQLFLKADYSLMIKDDPIVTLLGEDCDGVESGWWLTQAEKVTIIKQIIHAKAIKPSSSSFSSSSPTFSSSLSWKKSSCPPEVCHGNPAVFSATAAAALTRLEEDPDRGQHYFLGGGQHQDSATVDSAFWRWSPSLIFTKVVVTNRIMLVVMVFWCPKWPRIVLLVVVTLLKVLESSYDSFSDVGENRVYFASKILTPCRMHWNAFLIAQIIAKCHSFPNM